jgi:hypothetical protein
MAAKARPDVESLYHDLLHKWYEEADLTGAESIAKRLSHRLEREPAAAESIRGDEIRSLLAELRGDWDEAIHHRQREIRRILELHTLSSEGVGEYVLQQYEYGDIADRLDLLANLYANQGNLDRAVETLIESRDFCELHGIPFDGQDLLEELEADRRSKAAVH